MAGMASGSTIVGMLVDPRYKFCTNFIFLDVAAVENTCEERNSLDGWFLAAEVALGGVVRVWSRGGAANYLRGQSTLHLAPALHTAQWNSRQSAEHCSQGISPDTNIADGYIQSFYKDVLPSIS